MRRLPPSANTHLDAEGVMHGDDFGDSYYSRFDGLGETRAVFLHGCGLPDAWANQEHFIIAELGFGTGLNFLATCEIWRKTRAKGSMLHFISVEGYLMDAEDARAAHQTWPELDVLSRMLIARWPTRAYGAQRIIFSDEGICLTLLIGPCEDALAEMDFKADCWFLDGFSPARNPEMWTTEVFAQIARLSAPRARLATYSVASGVRAALVQAGFDVEKAPGFGQKKQRLEAVFTGAPTVRARAVRSAIIVGGGIAGASLCAALRTRGITADLFDDDICGARKASGNPLALVKPRLDRADTREGKFFRAAYLMAVDTYSQMETTAFSRTGVTEMANAHKSQERLSDLADNPPLPPHHIISHDGLNLNHERAGIAYPDIVLKTLKERARIHPKHVAKLVKQGDQWCALDCAGAIMARADICVIANALDARTLYDLSACGLGGQLIGRLGQLSWADLNGVPLTKPISGGGYAAPFGNKLCFGATFDAIDHDTPLPPPDVAGHVRNRDLLLELVPELGARIDLDTASGRTSVRARTYDHMPVVGRLPEDGPFILNGLGALGFSTAFLCAELIASLACGEPSPVGREVTAALAPDRFAKRAARRGHAPKGD